MKVLAVINGKDGVEALHSHVANEQQFLAAVEEGKQALKEGRVIDHKMVVIAAASVPDSYAHLDQLLTD